MGNLSGKEELIANLLRVAVAGRYGETCRPFALIQRLIQSPVRPRKGTEAGACERDCRLALDCRGRAACSQLIVGTRATFAWSAAGTRPLRGCDDEGPI